MDIHEPVYSEDESDKNEEPLNLSINTKSLSQTSLTNSNSSSSISNQISTTSYFGHSFISNSTPNSSFCQLSKFVDCENIEKKDAKIIISSSRGDKIIRDGATNVSSFSQCHGIQGLYRDLRLSPIPSPCPTVRPQPSIVSHGPRLMPRFQPPIIVPNVPRPMSAPLPKMLHRQPIPSSTICSPLNTPRQCRPTLGNPPINQLPWRQCNSMSSVRSPIVYHRQPIPITEIRHEHQIQQLPNCPINVNCGPPRSPFGQMVFRQPTDVLRRSPSNLSSVSTLIRIPHQEPVQQFTPQNSPYCFQISPCHLPQSTSTSTSGPQCNSITQASASLYSVENNDGEECTLLYHTHLLSPGMISCQVTPLSPHSESNSSVSNIVKQILDMESSNTNVPFQSPTQSTSKSSFPISQSASQSQSKPPLQTPSPPISHTSPSPTFRFSSPDDVFATHFSDHEPSTSTRGSLYTSKENMKDLDVITIDSDDDLKSSNEKKKSVNMDKGIPDGSDDTRGISKMEKLTQKLPGDWDNMDLILRKTFAVPHDRWFMREGIAHRVVGRNPTLLQKKQEKSPQYRSTREKLTRKLTRQEQKIRRQKALLNMEVEKHNHEVENACLKDTVTELKIQKLCLLRTIFEHEKKCEHKCNINYNEYLQDFSSKVDQPHCSSMCFDEGGKAHGVEFITKKPKEVGKQTCPKNTGKRVYEETRYTDDDSTSDTDD